MARTPLDLALSWNTHARNALFGYDYQHLYTIRLIRAVVDELRYDAFAEERFEDWIAWRYSNAEPYEISHILLVQIKARSASCYLEDGAGVDDSLARFAAAVPKLQEYPGADLEFRLVYNTLPTHTCPGDACPDLEATGSGLAALQAAMLARGAKPPSLKDVLEPFLPLPVTPESLRLELAFLDRHNPALSAFLSHPDRLADVVAALTSQARPWLPIKRSSPRIDEKEFPLGALRYERQDLRTRFGRSLRALTDDSHEAHQRASREAEDHARELAQRLLRKAARAEDPTRHVAKLGHADPGTALAKSLLLSESTPAASTVIRTDRILTADQEASLEILSERSTTLSEYLAGSATHISRIRLLLSLCDSLAAAAHRGLRLVNFRAFEDNYQHLYRVTVGSTAALIIIDHGAFDFSADSLIDSRWATGSVIASALRQVYYGSAADWKTTELYTAHWNDNIVADIATWVSNALLLRLSTISDAMRMAFRDEVTAVPLFVSDVGDDLIRRLFRHSGTTLAALLAQFEATHALSDRGPRRQLLYFINKQKLEPLPREQFGTKRMHDSLHKLVTYAAYGSYRWDRAGDRDLKFAVPLNGPRTRAVFVVVPSIEQARQVATHMFDCGLDGVSRWIGELHRDSELARSQIFAGVLGPFQAEWDILNRRMDLLRQLNDLEVPYKSYKREGPPRKLTTPVRLDDRLIALGYPASRHSQLTVCAQDDSGAGVRASLSHISSSIDGCEVELNLDADDDEEATELGQGLFSVRNIGEEAVLRHDAAAVRELLAFPGESAGQAAAWIEGWFSAPDHTKAAAQGAVEDAETLAWSLISTARSFKDSVVITGAAGTGKSRLLADLCGKHLSRPRGAESLRSPRILVVAATHYAVDNIYKLLVTAKADGIVPFRNLPKRSPEDLVDNGTIDRQVYAWHREMVRSLERFATRIPSDSLPPTRPTINDSTRLVELHGAIASPDSVRGAFVPSHERWRTLYGRPHARVAARERIVLDEELKVALEREKAVASAKAGRVRKDRRFTKLFAKLGASIVTSTVDALDGFPEVAFDLVVFEEASQLSLLKILKVLTKVLRGNGGDVIPAIVFSGDPRQLGPFSGTAEGVLPVDEKRASSISHERRDDDAFDQTPLDVLMKAFPERVVTLSDQHRLGGEIGELVREVFYPDQKWRFAKSSGEVRWIDTSLFREQAKKEESSWHNKEEREQIAKLVADLKEPDVLVLSPYTAQVRHLKSRLGNVPVKTIDGAQGVTADVVIVSLVKSKFKPNDDFVVDPRRLNVALSRASRRLFIVGNFTVAERSADALRGNHRYRHARALVDQFRGRFANRRRLVSQLT